MKSRRRIAFPEAKDCAWLVQLQQGFATSGMGGLGISLHGSNPELPMSANLCEKPWRHVILAAVILALLRGIG
jgi:hypothetical protein